MFACGDGGYYVNHLKWDSWGVRRAEGNGIFHMNDCDPSCAGGTFHKRSGRLVLRYRKHCHDDGVYVFRQARVTYERKWRGERKSRFELYCPLPD
jgi:hypothetical protein